VFVTYITWPMFDLRLSTPDLELRAVAEQDLASLSELLPDDMEQNPYATTFDVSAPQSRAVVLHQGYWKDMGTWQPDAWVLQFAVFQGGRLMATKPLKPMTSQRCAPSIRPPGWYLTCEAPVLASRCVEPSLHWRSGLWWRSPPSPLPGTTITPRSRSVGRWGTDRMDCLGTRETTIPPRWCTCG